MSKRRLIRNALPLENKNHKPQVMAKTTAQTKTRQRADWLISLGCSPLPVAPAQAKPLGKNGKPLFNGKNPSYLDADGNSHLIQHTQYRDKRPTTDELDTWFANPKNGIGTLAGQGGISWIDLDRKNFDSESACDNARAQILERCDRTYYETTKNGGYHIAVRLQEPKDFTNFKLAAGAPHVGEFLGDGRFVVISPSPGYSSLNGDEIASVESVNSLGLLKVRESKANAELATPKAIDPSLKPVAIEKLISQKCKDILRGKSTDDVSASLVQLAREAFGVAEWYPAQGLPIVGTADALIQKAAEKLGVDSDRLSRILQGINPLGNLPGLVKFGSEEKAIAKFNKLQKFDADSGELCKELLKIQDLRKEYGERVRFNELSQKIEIDGVTLEDIEGERIYYIEKTNKSVGVDSFCSVLRVIAAENSYHPVALYLEDVSEKHGNDTKILDGIAKRYFGVSNPLYDTYLKRWLISAVARIRKPGCKADCALFLQGGQGVRKSTFFSALSGDDFFSDSLGDTQSNKDEILLMHRFWIHEWSELETVFRKKEMASVKSFMARRFDSVRPPYRRDLIDLKRRCVFAGTTNENAFLSDNTGDRRFWTIPVQGKIPTDLLKEERDRIWAAAVSLYEAGEQWFLTEDEETASRELNAQFRSLDPWHEKIEAFITSKPSTTINEVLTGCFEYELKAIGRKEQLRVSGVLTALGWKSSVTKEYGKTVRRWMPEFSPTEITLRELQQVDSWAGYTEVADNCTKQVLTDAWAQLSEEHQKLILSLEPKLEPEPSENIEWQAVDTPAFKAGDAVTYFGPKYLDLHEMDLVISTVSAGTASCKKPDGSFTTNLPIGEIRIKV